MEIGSSLSIASAGIFGGALSAFGPRPLGDNLTVRGMAGVSGSLNVGEFARTTMSLSTGSEAVFLWQQRFHLLICPAGFQPVRFR